MIKNTIKTLSRIVTNDVHDDEKQATNFEAARRFVEMKREQGQESLSGPGSWLENTKDTVSFLNRIIKERDVKSILDLGCGDWNWFQQINLEGVHYIGWDADRQMIDDNLAKFSKKNIQFEVMDIVKSDYPNVDLILCRDVLFHMDFDLALKIIAKAKQNNGYFAATSYKDSETNRGPRQYTNFSGWGYYDINLDVSPFDLIEFEIDSQQEMKNSRPHNRRLVCLYDFSSDALPSN